MELFFERVMWRSDAPKAVNRFIIDYADKGVCLFQICCYCIMGVIKKIIARKKIFVARETKCTIAEVNAPVLMR